MKADDMWAMTLMQLTASNALHQADYPSCHGIERLIDEIICSNYMVYSTNSKHTVWRS